MNIELASGENLNFQRPGVSVDVPLSSSGRHVVALTSDLTGYATTASLTAYEKKSDLTANYYTKDQLTGTTGVLTSYETKSDLTANYYTKNQLTGTTGILTSYAKKIELGYQMEISAADSDTLSVQLTDRTITWVDQNSASAITATFPNQSASGFARDFILALSCVSAVPNISFDNAFQLLWDEDDDLDPEEGVNLYFFSEIKQPGTYFAARKLIKEIDEGGDPTNCEELSAKILKKKHQSVDTLDEAASALNVTVEADTTINTLLSSF